MLELFADATVPLWAYVVVVLSWFILFIDDWT